MASRTYHLLLLITVLVFGIWSGINPVDTRLTWLLETLPVMLALPVILLILLTQLHNRQLLKIDRS
jgi:uncharacterized membrane protein YjdF